MIPKTIHYCWFGRNPKPKLAEKCIKSWKSYLPDYEMVEWNEDNFDISAAPLYVRQAYEAKKWAFVTDYVRLWALTQFGGIYMDTDVEVIKSLDVFLSEKAFSGFEAINRVPTGIMACEKGYPLFKDLLLDYNESSFINNDGSYNLQTNVERITDMCLKRGLVLNGQKQTIASLTLYPVDYFCPLNYENGKLKKTPHTCTIHWFNGSWQSDADKKRHKKDIRTEKVNKVKRSILLLSQSIIGGERTDKLISWFKK